MPERQTERPRICVVGSANIDLIFQTPRLPLPGETIGGNALHQCMGGKGANQAVVAARLGGEVTFVAKVGNDNFGEQAIQAYEAEGIAVAQVGRSKQNPTGTAAILVDDTAENCIVVVPGANAELSPSDIRSAASVIESAQVVLSQLETPVEAAIAAFEMARASGVMTMLTPAPAEKVSEQLLALCDICVPNKTEIAAIVGKPVDSPADAMQAAKLLLDRGVQKVALTMGREGVLVHDGAGCTLLPATEVQAVDTTGAGDAFTGALGDALARGQDFLPAAYFASRVAALSVTRIGTQPSFPSMEEVEAWSP